MKQALAPAASPKDLPQALKQVGGMKRMDTAEYLPAVYFLVRGGTVVYVGQSTKPRARIQQHQAEGTKQFDSVFLRHCEPAELDGLESMFIHMLEPEYNCTLPNGEKLAPQALTEAQAVARMLMKHTVNDKEPNRPDRDTGDTKNHGLALPPPAPATTGARLLRLKEVMHRCGIGKTCIYDAMKVGMFPRCVSFGRASLWDEGAINAWISARLAGSKS